MFRKSGYLLLVPAHNRTDAPSVCEYSCDKYGHSMHTIVVTPPNFKV